MLYQVSLTNSGNSNIMQKFEDTKGIISRKSTKKTDYAMARRERTKGQTTIYKTLHRKHKRSSNTNFTKKPERADSGGPVG
jgi:hypothetical protein